MRHLILSCILMSMLIVAAGAAEISPDRKSAEPLPVAPELSAGTSKLLEQAGKRVSSINTAELQALLRPQSPTVVIDVRNEDEINLNGGYIRAENFFNIPRGNLEFEMETQVPDKSTPVVVYDDFGRRSVLAADSLVKLGYKNVKNYADGYYKWKQAGLPVKYKDKALNSFLYSEPVEVIPGVWTSIGETAPGSYENSGHNNNLSFVITDDGVVVMNSGDNYLLAQSLHEEIKKRTRQPVKYVVLENSQGHAMLGSNYWKEQGAKIIAHAEAAKIIEEHGEGILQSMKRRARDKAFKTELVMPDIIVSGESYSLKMGSWNMQVIYQGKSHSHGDLSLWIPEKKLVISGDVAFHERIPPLFEDTDTAAWLETWKKFEALDAVYVIPGHGGPTNMQEVTSVTKGYLTFLREKVAEVIKHGGSLADAYKIDQRPFAYLDTYHELHTRNAGMVFREMEF